MTVTEQSTPTITDPPRTHRTQARRRTRRWLVAAAAAAAVATGALVAPSLPLGGRAPIDSAAAAVLTAAAAKTGTGDPAIQPGQYRYIATHGWSGRGTAGPDGKHIEYLSEGLQELWVPTVWSQQWMKRTSTTGNRTWIAGTEQDAKAVGLPLEGPQQGPAEVAPCGDFNAKDDGREPCVGMPAGWQMPTEEWMAGLPRDPHKLLERLRADAPGADEGNDRGDVELLVYAADALRTGLLPADLRAALYRALALVPSLKVVEHSVNLDGRTGTALGMDTDGERHDILIDPATGEFIGERQVITRTAGAIKPGTTIAYTAVSTSTVNKIGTTPHN
ncbi:hypothetical protein C1I99_00720 [Micromonospora deserti]|uniref:CU044_5270 family protein n=2 Tax=Micromonospora deserti TaxID=2070366 RepID=A0A2W2EDM9_9ACTN|nr:hypothetical protein C1I99_00720 [Micromonospora deserti]